MKNIPDVIYLQIGDDCDCEDFKEMVIEHGEEITWCEDRKNGNDIKYTIAEKI